MSKMRWVVAMVVAGWMGSAAATNEMEESFDAADAGRYQQAMSIWQKLAAQGDAQAQFNLGLMYHGGLGMPRDEAEAVKWYEKAAEGGYPQAEIYLSVGYQEGWFGLPKNSSKADFWRARLEQQNIQH